MKLKGPRNNFIREILKRGIISVVDFCNLQDKELSDDNYFRKLEENYNKNSEGGSIPKVENKNESDSNNNPKKNNLIPPKFKPGVHRMPKPPSINKFMIPKPVIPSVKEPVKQENKEDINNIDKINNEPKINKNIISEPNNNDNEPIISQAQNTDKNDIFNIVESNVNINDNININSGISIGGDKPTINNDINIEGPISIDNKEENDKKDNIKPPMEENTNIIKNDNINQNIDIGSSDNDLNIKNEEKKTETNKSKVDMLLDMLKKSKEQVGKKKKKNKKSTTDKKKDKTNKKCIIITISKTALRNGKMIQKSKRKKP